MFRNLIDKIGESTLTALAEAGISPNRSSDSQRRDGLPPLSNDRFSIDDEEEARDLSRGTTLKSGFSSVDLSVPGAVMSPLVSHSRRSSSSSIMSDVSFIRPGSSFHMNASDVESASEFGDSFGSQSCSIQQLNDALRKSQEGYNKYKGRYSDLTRHYRELERDNVKTKKVLAEFQDRCLRREAELKEQCLLEQRAKAHLEEVLRNELEEKDHLIKTLITKIELLKSQGETNEDIVGAPLVAATTFQDRCLETQQNRDDGEEYIDFITHKTEVEDEFIYSTNPNLDNLNEELQALVRELEEKTVSLGAEKTDVERRLTAVLDELTQAKEEISMMKQRLTEEIASIYSSQEKGATMHDNNQGEDADISPSKAQEQNVQEKNNNAVLPPYDESVQDRIWSRAGKVEELTTKRNELERFMKITQFIDNNDENNVLRLKHVNFLCKKVRGILLTEPVDAKHLLSEDLDLDMDEAVETLKTKLTHTEYQRLLTAWLHWKRAHCDDVNLVNDELTLVQTLIETTMGILKAAAQEVQNSSDKNKDIKQQIVDLREEQTARHNHVTYIRQTLEDAEHRNDQLLSEILGIENKADSFKSLVEDLQKQNSGLQEDLEKLNQNNELLMEDAKESTKRLYSQIEEFQSLVVSLKSQIEDLQKQNTSLQKELKELNLPSLTDDESNTSTDGEKELTDSLDDLPLLLMRNRLLEEEVQRMKENAIYSAAAEILVQQHDDKVSKLQEDCRLKVKQLSKDFEKQLHEKIQELTETHEVEIGLLREEEGNKILQLKKQLKLYKSTAKQAEQNLTECQTLQEEEMKAKNVEILALKEECLSITAKYEADLREAIKKWRQHSDQEIEALKASHLEELHALSQEWRTERKSVSGSDSTPCGTQQELEDTNRVALAAVGSTTGTLEMLQREVMSQKQEMEQLKQFHKVEIEMHAMHQGGDTPHNAEGSSGDYSKEYLRNVLFEFMMNTSTQSVLVKVLADLVQLNPEQKKQVLDKFEQKPRVFTFGML